MTLVWTVIAIVRMIRTVHQFACLFLAIFWTVAANMRLNLDDLLVLHLHVLVQPYGGTKMQRHYQTVESSR